MSTKSRAVLFKETRFQIKELLEIQRGLVERALTGVRRTPCFTMNHLYELRTVYLSPGTSPFFNL